jgi:hypothetical protein
MKYLNCLWAVLFALGLPACEFESYRNYSTPEYEGVFTWTQVTKKAAWPKRWDHSSLSFNGRLWVMGGYNPGLVKGDTYLEDVWSSADGLNWEQETASAPWLGRRGHASVVFDDGNGEAMYVIGGFVVDEESGYREYRNDVWRSPDGKQWTQIKERTEPEPDSLFDWHPRFNHACVVANHGGTEYIYLIGGYTMLEGMESRYSMKYFNDVWRSTNGISWERLYNTDFGIRSELAAVADPASGRIYIQGGRHGIMVQDSLNGLHPHPEFYWLWSSDDGINWIPENDTAEFEQGYLLRAEHQLVLMEETLFGFPGRKASNVHFLFADEAQYTFWRRDPGNLWSVDSRGSDFGARYGYGLVHHEGKVWVLGGDTNAHGPDNDVWYGEIN